jgi:hypothetical protein
MKKHKILMVQHGSPEGTDKSQHVVTKLIYRGKAAGLLIGQNGDPFGIPFCPIRFLNYMRKTTRGIEK